MIQIKKQPGKDTIFASCDQKYFSAHAPALIASSVVNDLNVHIHVINPTDEWHRESDDIAAKAELLNYRARVSYSFNKVDLSSFPKGDGIRSFYACSRFQYLREIFSGDLNNLLVVDVDCMVMDKIDFNKIVGNVGMFIRKPFPGLEEESTIAAGVVYLDSGLGGVYANRIAQAFNQLEATDYRWFVDQKLLYKIYKEFANHIVITNLGETPDFMDWEFTDTSKIWTGKGDRKYSNARYLEAKARYERLLEDGYET